LCPVLFMKVSLQDESLLQTGKDQVQCSPGAGEECLDESKRVVPGLSETEKRRNAARDKLQPLPLL